MLDLKSPRSGRTAVNKSQNTLLSIFDLKNNILLANKNIYYIAIYNYIYFRTKLINYVQIFDK